VGGAGFDTEAVTATGGSFGHLSERYGSEARFVEDLVADEPRLGERLTPGLPYVWAEAVYAVRHEMARTVSDVLTRRIPVRFLDSAQAAAAAGGVGDLLVAELGVPRDLVDAQIAAFVDDIAAERQELLAPGEQEASSAVR
jgi:glycerol-3-phosphate dehydrogenase